VQYVTNKCAACVYSEYGTIYRDHEGLGILA